MEGDEDRLANETLIASMSTSEVDALLAAVALAVDASGSVSVRTGGILDWESRREISFGVEAEDLGGLVGSRTVTLTLTDAADARVTGLSLAVSGNPGQPATPESAIELPTAGGTAFWVHGIDFSPTTAQLSR